MDPDKPYLQLMHKLALLDGHHRALQEYRDHLIHLRVSARALSESDVLPLSQLERDTILAIIPWSQARQARTEEELRETAGNIHAVKDAMTEISGER